mmetsp:Transcript_6493/g.4880  ORF Transcript_6493/g.4880 Transcript_6493/m.4880 type:complete len:107 (+) Transcript_6493:1163-1483(+)|eukprot:CAMPEP_0202966798 /NCGR_PEP_ID=MMETSP1396-20130829/11364_1 /ASSEMBLY_ACC=CAM_ASM_000872 /TAXON_ID= /ORGANISM="Pseudokeronopsis sp., Strain Brazil" /LENGTH=106 /DNA_ID=CAMNT_0049691067 /DNA_START=1206 /DNA_END=1526 /DNA_ORIENTATION=-
MNKNGYIDYTEFIAACLKSYILREEQDLNAAFYQFDLDNDGEISIDELKRILKGDKFGASDEDIKLLIDEVDLNKDQKINYNEFMKMMVADAKVDLNNIGFEISKA